MRHSAKEPCPCGSGARFKNCCQKLSREQRKKRWSSDPKPQLETIAVPTREGLWLYQYDPDNPVHVVEHAGIKVHRPHPYLELEFRQAFMAHLRSRGFSSGRRRGAEANALIQEMYRYCRARHDETLDQVASRFHVEFCFEQLDIWAKIELKLPTVTMAAAALAIKKAAPVARNALQFMLEASTLHGVPEGSRAGSSEIFRYTDIALIAAEYLVNLSAYSTMAHAVLPDFTYAELRLEGSGDWFDLGTEPPVRTRMNEFMDARSGWRGGKYAEFYEPGRAGAIPEYLNAAFRDSHGITFGELAGSLRVLNDSVSSPKAGFDVPFVRRELCVEALVKNAGLTPEHADLALAGVTLTPDLLRAEPREMWLPKQASRVLRRFLLLLPHEIGPHLCWRREELDRSLLYLLQEACFRRLPQEWVTPGVEAALTSLSAALDSEWEGVVAAELRRRGLRCLAAVLKVQDGNGGFVRLDARGLPGEIDVLAVAEDPPMIIVVEVKRTQPSYSPAHFRDDKSKFIDGEKSYCQKHAAKVRWVGENLALVQAHLAASGIATAAADVRGVMVTKYESFARVLGPLHPVISLGRLLERFDQAGEWIVGPRVEGRSGQGPPGGP